MARLLKTVLRRLFDGVFRPTRVFVPARSTLRYLVSQPRIFDLVSLGLQLRWIGGVLRLERQEAASQGHLAAVHDYNAGVTTAKLVTSTRRAEPVYRIAGAATRDLSQDRLLIVGPRNVQEFLVAWIHGFAWRHIEAIDLYATHPKIRVMDMHHIDHPPESFDVVTMVNTLGYASDIPQVIAGVFRVLAPGGRFCFTHAHWPASTAFAGDLVSGETVLEHCRAAGFRVYFHEFRTQMNSKKSLQTSHFVGVEKPASPQAAQA